MCKRREVEVKTHIRKGDLVVVISGDDKVDNRKGSLPRRVIRVHPKEGRVVVEGVNLVYKHVRKSQKHPQGGRIRKEAPLDVSNVMLWCENCKGPVRIGIKVDEGKKERVCRKCGGVIETKK
ncbi:MAG: 50S ribosomal protein L24 [Planctomycetota bacterium]|nr:50S ribosomal protein L24 [Planctomycetota bacterium]